MFTNAGTKKRKNGLHGTPFEKSYHCSLDVGEGLYWHSTRTAAPAAASIIMPDPDNWPGL